MNERIFESITVGDIQTNCWIYSLPGEEGRLCAVIDPGDEAAAIIAFLKKLNLTPKYFLLTHGHFDHLSALPDLIEEYSGENPRPLTAIHSGDSQYLGSGSYVHHRDCMIAAGAGESYIKALWKPAPEADILLSDGDTIGPFKVIHLPGHTPGGAAFYDGAGGVLFSGDTLFHDGYGRTDLPGGNAKQLEQSLARLFALDGGVTVCPGHGPVSTIGREAQGAL